MFIRRQFKTRDVTNLKQRLTDTWNGLLQIIEKLVHKRLTTYLSDHNVLYKYQFGFRSHHDTTLAVIEMIDRISVAVDSKQYSLGIFIDLSKAFDSINQQILLDKLQHYCIHGIAHDWFASYLNSRQQFVDINGHKSLAMKISYGVPQGSSLGPLLFLIFANDVADVSKLLHFILFADDTNIFLSDSNFNTLIDTANNELILLTNWFQAICLTVDLNKSNLIVFLFP